MHRGFSKIVLVLVIVCWLGLFRLVVVSVEGMLFVVGLFLKVWIESPAVVGHIIVLMTVVTVGNVKHNLI